MDEVREIVASCRNCKTFETLWFKQDVLVPTRRFRQVDGIVYHSCNKILAPCRLFPVFLERREIRFFERRQVLLRGRVKGA